MSSMDEESLPQEDQLMDSCLEFADLITHKNLKYERDNLFEFIVQNVRLRAEEELMEYGYTDYPLLPEVVSPKMLTELGTTFSGQQLIYVNKVLLVLKSKRAISVGGSKYA